MLLLTLEDNESLISEIELLENKLNSIQESIEKLVSKNSRVAQNQILYQKDYDALVDEYYRLEPSLIEKEIKLKQRRKQAVDVKSFMKILEKQGNLVTKFDAKLFNTLVDKLIIYKEKKIEVHFKNSQVIYL